MIIISAFESIKGLANIPPIKLGFIGMLITLTKEHPNHVKTISTQLGKITITLVCTFTLNFKSPFATAIEFS